jgi:hemolysin activation/secretion protein
MTIKANGRVRCAQSHAGGLRLPIRLWTAFVVTAVVVAGLGFQARAAEPVAEDGPRYRADQILVDLWPDLPVRPPSSMLTALDVTLGVTSKGYVAPRPGIPTETIKLTDVPKLKEKHFYGSGLHHIGKRFTDYFRSWGYAGIIAEPHRDDITAEGKDVRMEGQTALRIVVRSEQPRVRPVYQPTMGQMPVMAGAPGAVGVSPAGKDFYHVTQFIVHLDKGLPLNPPLAELYDLTVAVEQTTSGWVVSHDPARQMMLRIGDVPKLQVQKFSRDVIDAMSRAVNGYFAARGHRDVAVGPHPAEIDKQGADTRFAHQTAMRLLVTKAITISPDVEFVPGRETYGRTSVAIVASKNDGQAYPVSQLIIDYEEDHPALPPLPEVMDLTVDLTPTTEGYIAAPAGAPKVRVKLIDVATLPKPVLFASAIRDINRTLVRYFNEKGFIGIFVAPNPDDIDSAGQDLRPDGHTALRIQIRTGIVREVRTIAAGDRVPDAERINNPVHNRLMAHAPIRAAKPGDVVPPDLLRKDLLDDFIYRMNRHPGRRVDVAVSPATEEGGVALDYLVTEAKPWMVYAQISNTGTQDTEEWRERFGFIHNQLTGNDDVLTIDYITAAFDKAHAVLASYEAPLGDSETVRWKVNGSWNEFTASDVGFANQNFTGNGWTAGADVIVNVWNEKEAFLDLFAGATWQTIEVTQTIGGTEISEQENFFLPHIGVKYEKFTETANTQGTVQFMMNLPDVANTNQASLFNLGRLNTADDFMVLTWDISHSFFLEPVLWPDQWADTSTPESSTLAHELYLSFRGQYGLNTRMPPQFERTAGGLYSVRGYGESLTAGDTVFLTTAEYRLHLPRLFSPSEPGDAPLFGAPFRWAPQEVYGRPDWNLMFRGFVDYASVQNEKRISTETNFDMLSAGVGVELLLKRNFSVRCDWGYILKEFNGTATEDEGDNRFHLVGTILY